MYFRYHRMELFPKLSWGAVVEKGGRYVDVYHGPWVETRDEFFVEGVWGGEFADGTFENSFDFMGTGGRLVDEGVLFCSPCHPLERINLIETSSGVFLSPSLACLLSMTGQELKLSDGHYSWAFLSFIRGVSNHVGSIPIRGGHVTVVHYRNVRIGRDLHMEVVPKERPEDFADYGSYKTFLTNTLSSIFDNGRSGDRKIKYGPLATLSSGYDSPACAALAKDAGCGEAVTLRLSAEEQELFGGGDDCGAAIAEALGLCIQARNPKEYLKYDSMPEAEFAATGYDDEDLVMSVFGRDFPQKIVVTGIHGDTMWNLIPKMKPVRRDIFRPDGCGCSLAEFRYRAGFIHVPLPLIGSMNYPAIHRITISEEMKPYAIGGNYDRPIPRRILEERGVERSMFGQKKVGLLPVYLGSSKTGLRNKMSYPSYVSFENYYQRHRKERSLFRNMFHAWMYGSFILYSRILFKVFRRKDLIKYLGCPVPEKFRKSPFRRSFLFHWGISMIKGRYDVGYRKGV
jgi:hypothetical protein